MSDKQPKAWTNEEISAFAANAPSAWEARRLYDAMRKVRDDLQLRTMELQAELAGILEIVIARGIVLGYDDGDEWRARFKELTGKGFGDE